MGLAFSQRSKPRVQGSVWIFSHQTRRCSLVRRDSPTGHQVRPVETVQSPRPCQTVASGGVSTPWIENGEPLPATARVFLTVRADVWCAAGFASCCSVPWAGNGAAGADGIWA